jgi:hypothetical protein
MPGRVPSNRRWVYNGYRPQRFPMLANRRTVMELILVIILLILLFGGGFGYYRGGYYSRGVVMASAGYWGLS